MKKLISLLCVLVLLLAVFVGCSPSGTLLDPKKPVTLTMWHVFGEQADSPMNRLVEEFNRTVGKNKGIIVDVKLMTNAAQIGAKLLNAQQGKVGAPPMPDLFFCHTSNAQELGVNNLLPWNERFTEAELTEFVKSFRDDGTLGDTLAVLPTSKSTHLLFLASGVFERFAAAKKVTYNDLATWDGFFDVAAKYYDYSGGKPFCALDYLVRAVELDAISRGATNFYNDNGWYNDNAILKNSYKKFADAIAKGHIVVSDLYSNTQVMTGQTVAGISSSAAVLYYNDKITYDDNSWEYINLKVLPLPQAEVGNKYATQAGVGLCSYKTTDQKAEAATVFAKWFTDEKRNLDFVAQTGYFPVKNGAFDKLADYTFKSAAFQNTQLALKKTMETCTFLPEPTMDGFYPNTYALYQGIRTLQQQLTEKYNSGATAESISQELVALFYGIGSTK